MRSVTMFLLESSWERDFSCLSMSSSTFSRQEGGDVSGGGEHDSVQELHMGLELITIGVALPVEIDHYSGLLDIGDQLLMLLDQGVKLAKLCGLLLLSALSHEDLKGLLEPFPDLSPLKILAEGVEGVSLPLEFRGGVDLVSHDSSDGLLHILHPLGHLEVPHLVDLLDEGIVFLPERHLDLLLLCCVPKP